MKNLHLCAPREVCWLMDQHEVGAAEAKKQAQPKGNTKEATTLTAAQVVHTRKATALLPRNLAAVCIAHLLKEPGNSWSSHTAFDGVVNPGG